MSKHYEGLTKKETEILLNEYADVINKKEAINRALYLGTISTDDLISWYNEHSDEGWSFPSEAAYSNLMDLELELSYRRRK